VGRGTARGCGHVGAAEAAAGGRGRDRGSTLVKMFTSMSYNCTWMTWNTSASPLGPWALNLQVLVIGWCCSARAGWRGGAGRRRGKEMRGCVEPRLVVSDRRGGVACCVRALCAAHVTAHGARRQDVRPVPVPRCRAYARAGCALSGRRCVSSKLDCGNAKFKQVENGIQRIAAVCGG
jgi:hypothetical protein